MYERDSLTARLQSEQTRADLVFVREAASRSPFRLTTGQAVVALIGPQRELTCEVALCTAEPFGDEGLRRQRVKMCELVHYVVGDAGGSFRSKPIRSLVPNSLTGQPSHRVAGTDSASVFDCDCDDPRHVRSPHLVQSHQDLSLAEHVVRALGDLANRRTANDVRLTRTFGSDDDVGMTSDERLDRELRPR